MAQEDEEKWLMRLSQYIDSPVMFCHHGAEIAFMCCMEKFLDSGYLGDVTDFHAGEKSLSLKLGKRNSTFFAKFFVNWIEVSQKFCCSYTVGADDCYMFWESDEPQKNVRDRIKSMFKLFMHQIDVEKDISYLKSTYDVEWAHKVW